MVFTPTGTAAAEGIDDLIKRVIGLPGETVTVADGRVLIDGGMLIEPYLADPFSTDDLQTVPWCLDGGMAKCTVPADHVFVLGDNPANSRDSRFFGPVPIDSIAGRAFARFWPWGRSTDSDPAGSKPTTPTQEQPAASPSTRRSTWSP
ncbi:MAG: hypothetical protein CM1200mP26_11550 [Acidimicrobiales bacterium]|nr:MAG: hypothetical protein CM1200mP26_11550 [Acidimicrobiales bacterium]